MGKRLGTLLSSLTILIIGMVIFISDLSIDMSALYKLIKFGVPACIVSYFLGILIAKVLARSCGDTSIISNIEQQQFIDDLLVEPSKISASNSFIEQSDELIMNEIGFESALQNKKEENNKE